jgi:uncharacterized protein YqgV (UPF0045/DUF77 family)
MFKVKALRAYEVFFLITIAFTTVESSWTRLNDCTLLLNIKIYNKKQAKAYMMDKIKNVRV